MGCPPHLPKNQAKSTFPNQSSIAQRNKKIGQSKLSSKQIKHEETHTNAVTTNDAGRIKIVAQKSGAKQYLEQVQQVIKVNIFIHDYILHQRSI
jgi:hypothetical protein